MVGPPLPNRSKDGDCKTLLLQKSEAEKINLIKGTLWPEEKGPRPSSSSETQGQIVGTRESRNGRKKLVRIKQ